MESRAHPRRQPITTCCNPRGCVPRCLGVLFEQSITTAKFPHNLAEGCQPLPAVTTGSSYSNSNPKPYNRGDLA